MIVAFLRTIILFILVIIIMRLMGKRQIGQLQPFEFAIAIMVSELAAIPMQNTGIPLLNGVIPILTLMILQLLISIFSMKSKVFSKLVDGTPSVLIENGKIVEKNLSRELYTINDLIEQLRIKNIPNIADVEFAILETNGQLSIIPKSQKRPVTPEDLNLNTSYEGLPLNIVVDGKPNNKALYAAKLDDVWLSQELSKIGVNDAGKILIASLDTKGNLFYQKKKQDLS